VRLLQERAESAQDRGAVEENSRGSRARKRACDSWNRRPVRAGRGAVAAIDGGTHGAHLYQPESLSGRVRKQATSACDRDSLWSNCERPGATAPRSARRGRVVPRVAREGSLHSPARDPRIPEPRCADRGAVALGSQFEPYESRSSAKREMPLCRDTTSIASPPTRIGTDDATAPRSVRHGGQFRGSRRGSLRSPRATHGYFIDRSAVAESWRATQGYCIDRGSGILARDSGLLHRPRSRSRNPGARPAAITSTAPRSRNPGARPTAIASTAPRSRNPGARLRAVTKPLCLPRVAMPRERVVIAFFKRRRRERARAHGVSRGYGRMRGPSPVGAIHPIAFFRSAVAAKAPEPTA